LQRDRDPDRSRRLRARIRPRPATRNRRLVDVRLQPPGGDQCLASQTVESAGRTFPLVCRAYGLCRLDRPGTGGVRPTSSFVFWVLSCAQLSSSPALLGGGVQEAPSCPSIGSIPRTARR